METPSSTGGSAYTAATTAEIKSTISSNWLNLLHFTDYLPFTGENGTLLLSWPFKAGEALNEDFPPSAITNFGMGAFSAYWTLASFCINNLLPLTLLWCANHWFVGSKKLQTVMTVAILWLCVGVASPVLVMGFVILFIVRFGIGFFLKIRYGDKIFLPPAMDAVWAVEAFASASTNTGFYVIKGRCDFEKVVAKIHWAMNHKLNGQELMWRLKHNLLTVMGFVAWEKIPDFDIRRQVKLVHDCDTSMPEVMDVSDIFTYLRNVQDYPFPRVNNKGEMISPWEIIVVPKYRHEENVDEEHYALILRLNHSLMDGISFGHVLYLVLADKPFKFALDPIAPINISSFTKTLGYALGLVMMPYVVLRNLMMKEKHAFHGPMLTGKKNYTWSRPIRMDSLRLMKNKSGTTVFAVLMSSVAGAIRHMFKLKGESIPDVIHAAPPVAMLPYPDRMPRNKFAIILLPVPVGLHNGVNRLKKVYEIGKNIAKSFEIVSSYFTIYVVGVLPAIAIRLTGILAHATLTLSNMPGPAEKVSMFGGDELVDIGAWVPIKYSIGIGTAMFSYGNRMRVTFVADESVMSSKHDVPTMCNAFEVQLTELAKSLGVVENLFDGPRTVFDGYRMDSQG